MNNSVSKYHPNIFKACTESYWKQSTHSVDLFIELQVKKIQKIDLAYKSKG